MDGGDETESIMYGHLLERLKSLEASHEKLKEQWTILSEESVVNVGRDSILRGKEDASDSDDVTSFPGWSRAPSELGLGSPYRSVLEHVGHAVHVSRAGEIIFWNHAAEKLFGYRDHEVFGQREVELLFDNEHHQLASEVMDRLSRGESWSGQFPLKKRSSQIFMALVTKNPVYEDGELFGIVTVSSDADVFNSTNSRCTRKYPDHGNEPPNAQRINLKNIQWHPQPRVASVPQFASSLSNLASKLRKRDDLTCNVCGSTRESECVQDEAEAQDPRANRPPRIPTGKPTFSFYFGKIRSEAMGGQREESTYEIAAPSKIVAKVLSKFQKGDANGQQRNMDGNIQQNGSPDASMNKETTYEPCHQKHMTEASSRFGNTDASNNSEDGFEACESTNRPSRSSPCERDLSNGKTLESEDASPRRSDSHTGESLGSGHGSSSSRGGNESHKAVECPIQWEDLTLLEEVGHGSFAAVYRGVWNGSDVAVKVYSGNQYSEQTLRDYKKEIDIMRRLRHPNVLLFMGAVSSEEKLAIVTEYMTRGSLFKALHKSNQSMDFRRRLRMATDVARGMNYLHHRNPPIVHRDLKSSNLLVDKSWTVKVGDFGLSKLKDATFLTAKSGRGTPQWMAPEVLRNEPSTEKSDIFSFGVILWELMTESIPWSNLNALQVVGIVGFMDRRLDLPANMDPRISTIISECWQRKPDDRPSFEDIIPRMTNLVHTANGSMTRTPSTPLSPHS